MNNTLQSIWAYTGAVLVWCFDHWSGFAALTLFGLQAVYQIYRIRIIKRECEEKESRDEQERRI
jgi:hypothetical protein